MSTSLYLLVSMCFEYLVCGVVFCEAVWYLNKKSDDSLFKRRPSKITRVLLMYAAWPFLLFTVLILPAVIKLFMMIKRRIISILNKKKV